MVFTTQHVMNLPSGIQNVFSKIDAQAASIVFETLGKFGERHYLDDDNCLSPPVDDTTFPTFARKSCDHSYCIDSRGIGFINGLACPIRGIRGLRIHDNANVWSCIQDSKLLIAGRVFSQSAQNCLEIIGTNEHVYWQQADDGIYCNDKFLIRAYVMERAASRTQELFSFLGLCHESSRLFICTNSIIDHFYDRRLTCEIGAFKVSERHTHYLLALYDDSLQCNDQEKTFHIFRDGEEVHRMSGVDISLFISNDGSAWAAILTQAHHRQKLIVNSFEVMDSYRLHDFMFLNDEGSKYVHVSAEDDTSSCGIYFHDGRKNPSINAGRMEEHSLAVSSNGNIYAWFQEGDDDEMCLKINGRSVYSGKMLFGTRFLFCNQPYLNVERKTIEFFSLNEESVDLICLPWDMIGK